MVYLNTYSYLGNPSVSLIGPLSCLGMLPANRISRSRTGLFTSAIQRYSRPECSLPIINQTLHHRSDGDDAPQARITMVRIEGGEPVS